MIDSQSVFQSQWDLAMASTCPFTDRKEPNNATPSSLMETFILGSFWVVMSTSYPSTHWIWCYIHFTFLVILFLWSSSEKTMMTPFQIFLESVSKWGAWVADCDVPTEVWKVCIFLSLNVLYADIPLRHWLSFALSLPVWQWHTHIPISIIHVVRVRRVWLMCPS